MRFPLYAGLVATLGLAWLATPAQAGPFGLFTKSMFAKGCLHCNCDKPYNAFSGPGCNPVMPQAPFGCGPEVGNGFYGPVVVGGCDTCAGGPVQAAPAAPAATPAPAAPQKHHLLHGLFGGSKK